MKLILTVMLSIILTGCCEPYGTHQLPLTVSAELMKTPAPLQTLENSN